MTNKITYKNKDTEVLADFLEKYYPPLADITLSGVQYYSGGDEISGNPLASSTWSKVKEGEPDGVELIFFRPIPVSPSELFVLANILMYSKHFCYHPKYGHLDIQDFKPEIDGCWHHTEVSRIQDIHGYHYVLRQGYCYCS